MSLKTHFHGIECGQELFFFVLQENEGRYLATDIEFSRDLIGRMLLCDPQKRLTAEEAFGMSIFEDMVDPEEGQAVS